jgi:hypothetical protein
LFDDPFELSENCSDCRNDINFEINIQQTHFEKNETRLFSKRDETSWNLSLIFEDLNVALPKEETNKTLPEQVGQPNTVLAFPKKELDSDKNKSLVKFAEKIGCCSNKAKLQNEMKQFYEYCNPNGNSCCQGIVSSKKKIKKLTKKNLISVLKIWENSVGIEQLKKHYCHFLSHQNFCKQTN